MRMKLRKINNNAILGACVIIMMLLCALSISQPLIFEKQMASREAEVKEKLMLIRSAEERYRAKHGVYTGDFAVLIKAKYLKAEDTLIPYSDGRKFSLAATTIIHKSGKQIPLMECGATYEDYLDGLNEEAIQQVTEKASDAGNFPGLKIGNNSKVTDAQNTYNQAIADLGQNKADSIELYTKAYSRLSGLKLSGDDKQLYNKLSVLAAVSGKYDAYKSFSDSGYVTMAADSLVCAAGRCAVNADNAKEYGCELQLEQLKNIISDTLSSQYGLSYDDAIALYNIDDRDDYTLALTQKLNELGIKEETK